MAQLACLRETRSHVIRAVRGGVFRAVASVTVGRNGCVVIVLVAVRAGHRRMLPRQREARIVVVEGRGRPSGRAVTHLALLWKIHGCMVRVIRALIVLLMAGVAGRRREIKVPVLVALPTLHVRMRTRERKRRLRMVKRCRLPSRRRVAHLALLRNPCRRVIRIVRIVVVGDVASHARRAGQLEITVLVALIALQIRMPAAKRETH